MKTVTLEYVEAWDFYNIYVDDKRVVRSDYVGEYAIKKLAEALGADFKTRTVEDSDGI